MIRAFQRGVWHRVTLPSPTDPVWSKDHCQLYAAAFLAFQEKGLENPGNLAEAHVYKKIYDVKFTKKVEQDLLEIA